MIIPKRWTKLTEVRERLLQHPLESSEICKAGSDPEAAANRLCWDFCEQSERVFLHKHAEEAIEYPKENLIEPPKGGKHLLKNEIVDLCVGVPGSGTVEFVAVGKGPKIYNISGPYIGSLVLFERKEFDRHYLKLTGPETASPLGSVAGIKEHLLKMHKSGKYTNKEEAWGEIKSEVTWRKFDQGFKAAKKEDSTFGKVGRPLSNNMQHKKSNN